MSPCVNNAEVTKTTSTYPETGTAELLTPYKQVKPTETLKVSAWEYGRGRRPSAQPDKLFMIYVFGQMINRSFHRMISLIRCSSEYICIWETIAHGWYDSHFTVSVGHLHANTAISHIHYFRWTICKYCRCNCATCCIGNRGGGYFIIQILHLHTAPAQYVKVIYMI